MKHLSFIIYHLSFSVALSAALTACTGDDDGGTRRPGAGEVISFTTDVEAAETRGAAFSSINDLDALKALPEGFGVMAYSTETEQWEAAKSSVSNFFMYNQPVTWQVSYVTGSGDSQEAHYAWLYSPLKYWPNYNDNNVANARYVSFFAYAPYTAVTSGTTGATGNTGGITGMTYASDKSDDSDKLPHIDYTIPTDGTATDLLYASATNCTRNGQGLITVSGSTHTYQTVPLTFHHALAAVDIYVQRVYDETTSTGKHPDNAVDTKLFVNQLSVAVGGGGIYTGGRLSLEDGTWSYTGLTQSTPTMVYSGNDLMEKVGGAKPENTTLAYIADGELNKWDVTWNDQYARDANGTRRSGVTGDIEPLTNAQHPLLFIPQGNVTLTPTLTYSMVTKDNSLLLSTLTDDSGNKYSRITNIITGNSITLAFERGKRYKLIIRIGVEHIAFEVIDVEDWDFPMRFQPTVSDWSGNATYNKTLNE